MIVLRFENFQERYDEKFTYEVEEKSRVLKVLDRESGTCDLFNYEKILKIGQDVIFIIDIEKINDYNITV